MAADTPHKPDNAVQVGRGALYIGLAKLVFLATGAATSFVLARFLEPAAYGDYGVAIRVVSLANMMVVQGMMQGLSRAVSQRPDAAGTLLKQGLKGAAVVAVVASGVLALLSPVLAQMLGDGRLAVLLAVGAVITFSYAFYAAMVGVLNGLHRFGQQAALDTVFSILKMLGVVGGAALGLGALGSVAGFALAAVVVALGSRALMRDLGDGAPEHPLGVKALLSFSGWVMAYQALLNLLMFVDLGLTKRGVAAGTLADDAAGLYAAAVNLAQVPYLAGATATFIIFPVLGRAASLAKDAARQATFTGLKYALLVIGPPAVALMAAAPGAVAAIFPASYAGAAAPLRVLCVAYAATAVCGVVCTMLNALGAPGLSAVAVAVGCVVSLLVGVLLQGTLGMVGVALGSMAGMVVAAALGMVFLHRTGRAAFPWASLVRHALVAAVVCGTGMTVEWPQGDVMARLVGLAGTVGMGLASVALLVVVGEIGRPEWALLMGVLKRRKQAPA